MLIIDSLQYSNCYVLFSGLIIHKECRKSLWPLGSWVKTRAKFCLPIVIAWLLLERAAPMLLRSYRPLNRDVNAGLRWQWQRKRHTGFYQHQSCPSHSLIMSICHPEIPHFNTEATKWGSHYEKRARDAYCRYQKEMHVNAIANAVVVVDVRLRH